MTKTILSIFKEYIKRYKIFNMYSLYVLFRSILGGSMYLALKFLRLSDIGIIFEFIYYFIICMEIICVIWLVIKPYNEMYFKVLAVYILIMSFIYKYSSYIARAMTEIIFIYPIGVMFLRKVINTRIEKDRLKYKVTCYLILFVIFSSLKYIDIALRKYIDIALHKYILDFVYS